MTDFKELLSTSMNDKKGVTLFIKGQTVAGVVTGVREDGVVELRSMQYSRIQVRGGEIDAIAIA